MADPNQNPLMQLLETNGNPNPPISPSASAPIASQGFMDGGMNPRNQTAFEEAGLELPVDRYMKSLASAKKKKPSLMDRLLLEVDKSPALIERLRQRLGMPTQAQNPQPGVQPETQPVSTLYAPGDNSGQVIRTPPTQVPQ